MTKYIDLSLSIGSGFRSKADKTSEDIEIKRYRTYEKDNRMATSYTLSSHSYTHLDAPVHMVGPNEKTITDYPVDYFIGEASLIDVPRGESEQITGKDLEIAGKHCKDGDIVFIRTGWLEKMFGKEDFNDSPYLTDDAAEWLVKLKARIAGYDFVQDYIARVLNRTGEARTEEFTTHMILLGNGVLNLEYVTNLSKIDKPRFRAYVLPIKLQDFDGAPVRAVAEL